MFLWNDKTVLMLNDVQVSLLANLKWSNTDNFYMNLGCHKVGHLTLLSRYSLNWTKIAINHS